MSDSQGEGNVQESEEESEETLLPHDPFLQQGEQRGPFPSPEDQFLSTEEDASGSEMTREDAFEQETTGEDFSEQEMPQDLFIEEEQFEELEEQRFQEDFLQSESERSVLDIKDMPTEEESQTVDIGSKVKEVPEERPPIQNEQKESGGKNVEACSVESSPKMTTNSSETMSNLYSKLSPYFIRWSFGLKKCSGVINLTSPSTFEVFFASAHLGVVYDYRNNSMRFLPGHNFPVTCIASDMTGRWLVTADAGEDTTIIVWDNRFRLPIWTLYNAFPEQGTRCAAISHHGRFLAATNWGFEQVLKFWLWTFGNEDPDGVVNLGADHGIVRHISFDPADDEKFAVTLEKRIVFCEWIPERKTIETCAADVARLKNKLGLFKESLFVDSHRAVTSTSLGQIVVWCDVPFTEAVDYDSPGCVDKKYLKTIKIHKTGINSMRHVDQTIVTASDGMIAFHDQELRLLYWLPKFEPDPILCLSFHLLPRTDDQIDPFSPEFEQVRLSMRSTLEEESFEYFAKEEAGGWETENIKKKSNRKGSQQNYFDINQSKSGIFGERDTTTANLPSDCTIEMRPFLIRDFIFLTSSGKIGYVSHIRRKLKYFLPKSEAPVLSVDCNPLKNHLAVGNAAGRLTLYQFKTKDFLLSVRVADSGVSSLKYSPSGQVLVAGLESGEVLVLDPLLLDVRQTLETANSKVVKICFAPNSRLLAFFDESLGVCLYAENDEHCWVFMGRYNSHYKSICDIHFESDPEEPWAPRLFSLGQDRTLVEYDTKHLERERLKLVSLDRIEQTAVPLCFAWYPKFYDKANFFISNSEFKIKIFDINSRNCFKTTLGPTGDSPIKFMHVIPGWDKQEKKAKMIYATDKHIGIRLLPPTGNPFEGMGMVGHPEKLASIAVSHDQKYLFTTGVNDCTVLMWKINPKAVDIGHQLGGEGLEPFVPLIEGGPNGFLFKEIEDFFYYAQIVHQGEHANLERSVSKYISLCEVPDLIRSLGFYPTDFEVNNMLYELTHIHFEETGELADQVLFDDCVKIYLNYRPVNGILVETISKALLTIADMTDPEEIVVQREELYKALEGRAEAMSHQEVVGYLCILLLPKDEAQPIPSSMPLREFADDVLGIDLGITENHVRDVTHAFEGKI